MYLLYLFISLLLVALATMLLLDDHPIYCLILDGIGIFFVFLAASAGGLLH